jgi:hypothetical protein
MMRISKPNREQLKSRLEAERDKFQKYDEEKKSLISANIDIKRYEEVKALRKDCVDEINHLHKQMYPNFPHFGSCWYCGGVLTPALGKNRGLDGSCVVCERLTLNT